MSAYVQRSSPGGGVVLCSPLLEAAGVRHGFGTRLGGVSDGSKASLNLGLKGDRPENVRENLRRLGVSAGFDPDRCYRLRQVHGRDVVRVQDHVPPAGLITRPGDALISDQPGIAVGVVTADCVPVLFADPRHRAVAAAHAGWRGLAEGVLEATVAALGRTFGSRGEELLCAIGPCIGSCCYEIGEEVAACFDDGALLRGRGPRPHLDLAGAARARLQSVGLREAQISTAGICTKCRADLLYSYRRDGEATGHHLSVVAV